MFHDGGARGEAPDRTMGLRERKKAEAHVAIVRAALELFTKRGYADVTIDEIAERAGVARRTYFRYFPTKESVVFDRRMRQLEMLRQAMAAAPASASVLDVLRASLAALAADYTAARGRILAERELFASSPELAARDLAVDRLFEATIAEAVAARAPNTVAGRRGARLFAAATMGMLRVLLEEWAAGDGSMDLVRAGVPALEKIAALVPDEKAKKGERS